jgi:tetratricopeptide (TPR) repeat protein
MTGREDLFEESMNLANSAVWDQDWERAIEFYRKALAEFPENPTALTNLGLALFETGRMEESLGIYQQAMAIAQDDPVPAAKCAEIYEHKGDTRQSIEYREIAADLYVRRQNADKAIENWRHSARLDPWNLAIRARLAGSFERIGRNREALHELLQVASILQNNHKIERAIETVQRAMRLNPADAEAKSTLRALTEGVPLPPPQPPLKMTGEFRPSDQGGPEYLVQTTEQVEIEIESQDPEEEAQSRALTMLAALLFEESFGGSDDDASKGDGRGGATGRLRELRQSFGGTKKYQTLGKALDLQTRGNDRQAAKELKRAIDSGIDHPAAHYNLGLLYKSLHDYEGAHQHLMAAVGHPELALGANLALGRIEKSKSNLDDSARFLLQAFRLAVNTIVTEGQAPQFNDYFDNMLATLMESDEDTLSNYVENVLNILQGPDWKVRVDRLLGGILHEPDGPQTEPLRGLGGLGERGHDRVVNALERIDDLLGQGYHFSAMEEALLALEYTPSYLGLHLRIAEILLQTGRTEIGLDKLHAIAETHRVRGEAIPSTKIYHRILNLSPINIEARERLISLLSQQDRIDEAIREYIELANIYRQMAEISAARKTLADALQVAQLNAVETEQLVMILRELADIDIARLDWRRALLVYEQICKLDPSNDDAQIQVVDLNLRLGQEDGAANALDLFLQELVANNRGSEILPMLEEWTREYPGKQVLHSRLAEAYRAVGRKADAIAQYDALGEIQLDAGQIREAIRTIKTIMEMGPPDVEGYQELLKNLESGR